MDNKDLEFNQKLSQEFSQKDMNILVWTNSKTHKNLYMKVGKRNKDSQIELIPLDENELKDLHLEESISQTVNAGIFDIDIEESISDSEPAIKPIAKFNSNDPESMRLAKKMAEEQLAKLEGKTSSDITKEAVEHFQQEKENVSVELTALGLDTEPSDLRTVKDLTRAKTEISKLREMKEELKTKSTNSPKIPSGNVPLSSQTPAQGDNQGYGTYEAMVSDLRTRANRDPIAREALRQLTFKSLRGMRETHVESYSEPTPQTTSTDLIEDGKLSVKPDVCGIQHSFREKKLRALAEKGDQTALQILNSGDF